MLGNGSFSKIHCTASVEFDPLLWYRDNKHAENMFPSSMTTLRTLTCWLKQNRNNSAYSSTRQMSAIICIFSINHISSLCKFPMSDSVEIWENHSKWSNRQEVLFVCQRKYRRPYCKNVMTCYRQGRELLMTVPWQLKRERHKAVTL